MPNNEIVFDVVDTIGVIAKYQTGWKKEVNLISWNNGPAKIDIRDWDPDHLHMSKGVTLHTDEAKRLAMLLKKHFETGRYSRPAQQEAATQTQAPEPPILEREEAAPPQEETAPALEQLS